MNAPLRDVAALFLRLGVTAFGGPAVHVAMMEEEVVRRRKWMDHETFLDLYGATNLIPGPNSTEMAIHVGRHVAGFAGLLVAGACFIVPAALITLALAWAYVRFGHVPHVASVLWAVKPVVLVVVAQALWELAKKAVKSRPLALLGLAAIVANALGVHELLVLFAAGALSIGVRRGAPMWIVAPAIATAPAAPSLPGLFFVFAKIGSVLFGSGYVLLAFLRAELVDRLRWTTEAKLLDAVAAGQVTPGPVFSTATFVGYTIAGFGGAATATLGIFLPAFVFVAISAPLLPRLRRSQLAGRFLDGVNVASLALMAVVAFHLGRASLVDSATVALAGASSLLLLRFRVNSAWLVLGAAAIGVLSMVSRT